MPSTAQGRKGDRITAAVAAIGLACMLLLLVLPGPASARPPSSCNTLKYNVEGADYAQEYNHIGERTSMYFAPPSGSDCSRVSSIAVVANTDSGSVEFGWFLGWDYSNGNQYSGPGACRDGAYYGYQPELFVVWIPTGGGYHCKDIEGVGDDLFTTVALHDTNMNTVWDGDLAGEQVTNDADVNFSEGTAITNGERHNSSDRAHADFKSLQVQIAGDGSTWYDFASSGQYADNDPGFYWERVSVTHTQVLQN